MNKEHRTRFVESLDTVRHEPTKAKEERDKRELHASIEVMFSLLFGEQIVVSEPQSFDSLGFLNIAQTIIESRPKKSHGSPVYDPFMLALRPGHNSYSEMMIDMFRSEQFKLSGWPEITDNISKRKDLASLIEDNNFSGAKDFGRDKMNQLEILNKYFIEEEQIISTKVPDIPLTTYIDYLSKVDVGKLPRYMTMDHKEERVSELKNAANILKDRHIDLSNRSSLHQFGKDIFKKNILEGLLEYSNSCYNCVVANSLMANTSVFSTSEPGENDYVLSANSLVDLVMDDLSADKMIGRSYLSISNGNLIKQFEKFQIDWDVIWNVLTDENFIQSINKLNEYIRINDHIMAKNTLSNHIKFLDKNLPFEIKESKNGWTKLDIGDYIGFGIGSYIGAGIGNGVGIGKGVGAVIGGTIGKIGEALGSYCWKRINNWWIEGTLWGNVYRNVDIINRNGRYA